MQIQWLTLGAELAPSSAKLYLQLPQIDTVAYQANITVRRLRPHVACKAPRTLLAQTPCLCPCFHAHADAAYFLLGSHACEDTLCQHCDPPPPTDSTKFRVQLVGTGLAAPVAPLTLAEQTAILTLFQELLPPLFFGLGPQWTRFQSVQSDVATNTTNFSLLMDSILPPIWNDTDDTFPFVSALLDPDKWRCHHCQAPGRVLLISRGPCYLLNKTPACME